jgi:hypothetical protein
MNPNSQVGAFEATAFLATVGSLVLSVVAIWLSIVFYRMSSQLSETTKEAAKGIGSSVERLEKLFDKLYSDTFSMMRDTVSDMRKHIWPAPNVTADPVVEETEKKADEKVDDLKRTMEAELSNILGRLQHTNVKVEGLRTEMQSLIERAIVGSRRVEIEARSETVRQLVLRELGMRGGFRHAVAAEDLVGRLSVPTPRVLSELERLKDEGYVRTDTPHIRPNTEIQLTPKGAALLVPPMSDETPAA